MSRKYRLTYGAVMLHRRPVVSDRQSRVLVVDEDAVVRLTIDRQLDVLGWEAVPVDTGEDAIRIVELGLIVDVLLTELALPHMGGLALALAVTRLSPSTRVAFMSHAMPRMPLEPRDAPLLIKPFTTEALANALAGAPRYQPPATNYPR